jgi:hypothetical protein
LTKNNFNWGFDVSISERKKEIENLYQSKIGRRLDVRATPLREGVFLIDEERTNQEILEVVKGIEKEFGIKAIQLSVHRDEGHTDKDSGIWKPNLHAHVVFDWQNKETGKTFKLAKDDMSRLQDYFASRLQMERGKTSTKHHKNALDFKIGILEEQLKIKEEVKKAIDGDKLDDLTIRKPSIFNRNGIDTQMSIENYKNALKGLKIEILDLRRNLDSKNTKISEKDQKINELENSLVKMRQAMTDKLHIFKRREEYIAELERIIAFPERNKIDLNSQEIKEIRDRTLLQEKAEEKTKIKKVELKTKSNPQEEEQKLKGMRR